jgi:glycosyltransferase involved in cell wall biosynthesis
MTQFNVSVIVPTINRSMLLPGLFDSLSRQTFPPDRWELIVVNDGSSDDTHQKVERWARSAPVKVTIINQRHLGSAMARNHGSTRATGAVLLFLDDDMIAMPTLVAGHASAHEAPAIAALGRISAPSHRNEPWTIWEDNQFALRSRAIEEGRRVLGPRDFYSGNCSVPADLFARIGGFNKDLARTYDIELGYRIVAAGGKLAYRADAESIHRGSHTFEKWVQNARALGESEVVLGWELGHSELKTELFGWFLRRHPLNRLLIRLCSHRPALEAPLVRTIHRIGRVSHRLKVAWAADAAYSAIFNLAYWMRIVAAIGPDAFRSGVEGAGSGRIDHAPASAPRTRG